MPTPRYWIAVLVLASATPVLAQQPAAAGRIRVASGPAFIVRDGGSLPATEGQAVFQSDALQTGPGGRIGVLLNDDTRLSLGPSSEVRLDRFTYAPASDHFAMVLQIVRGVAAYVSGRIAKLAPDSVRLETPAAIVGVRGTSLAIRVEPQ